jgi:anti-sigma28 factor (negative regulator of flagellin synthesis)
MRSTFLASAKKQLEICVKSMAIKYESISGLNSGLEAKVIELKEEIEGGIYYVSYL